jgi:hypothetical protein
VEGGGEGAGCAHNMVRTEPIHITHMVDLAQCRGCQRCVHWGAVKTALQQYRHCTITAAAAAVCISPAEEESLVLLLCDLTPDQGVTQA